MSATKLYRTKRTFQQCIDYVDIITLGGVKQAILKINASISRKL